MKGIQAEVVAQFNKHLGGARKLFFTLLVFLKDTELFTFIEYRLRIADDVKGLVKTKKDHEIHEKCFSRVFQLWEVHFNF